MRKTWTFLLTDGDEFEVRIGANPTVSHNGGISIWTLHLTNTEKDNLEDFFTKNKQRYQTLTTDEKLEKETTLKVKDMDSVFHCSQCFSCCWFDLSSPNKCKAMDLPHKLVREMIAKENSIHSQAYRLCPVLNKDTE